MRSTPKRSGFPLGRLDDFLAAHVGAHGLRNLDGAILLLMVLQDRDEPARGGQRAVERGDRAGGTVLVALADVQAAGLVLGAVRGGGELAVAALGRDPRLGVELAGCGGAEALSRADV